MAHLNSAEGIQNMCATQIMTKSKSLRTDFSSHGGALNQGLISCFQNASQTLIFISLILILYSQMPPPVSAGRGILAGIITIGSCSSAADTLVRFSTPARTNSRAVSLRD